MFNKPSHLFQTSLFATLIIVLIGCAKTVPEEEYVARVYNKYLTQEMLASKIPATVSREDSIKRAKVYINSWVKEQVVLRKAEFNLNAEDARFKSKMEEYLRDLMIFEYEQSLVRQSLDTMVTDEVMREFYEENKQNFILKDYVVKARYMIVPEQTEDVNQLVKKFSRYTEQDSLDIDEYVQLNGVSFSDVPEEWMYVPSLLEVVPINFSYFENKVKQKNFFDKIEDGNRYLLYVRDFKVRDSETPFELERTRIRSIIMNTKKKELLDNMRTELFQDALENGQIEIIE